MTQRILPRQADERDSDFFRRCAQVMDRRAQQLLREGRNPAEASTLAVDLRKHAETLEQDLAVSR